MKYLQKQIQLYREAQQSLSQDSDRLEVEQVILLGIHFYNLLMSTDEVWRRSVFRQEHDYDPLMEEGYSFLLNQWELITSQLLIHSSRFNELAHLLEIRSIIENQNISLDVNDNLVRLRDEALDAHRRGETIPIF